ncbi:MAG TPA: rhodanese-like domain-containing protein [Planctomycetota bacterium]|nr:rhodanese-like domain-containing protein [Planctomycetota bacterium]
MPVKRVTPEQALELMRGEGYSYLDVRSVPEFDEGHPAGAFNVPLLHMGPGGGQPNRDFLSVMERRFPKDARLVVGCRSAGRSVQAVALLEQSGFTDLVLQQSGFVGGSPMDPGWGPKGLPASRSAELGHSWEELKGAAE